MGILSRNFVSDSSVVANVCHSIDSGVSDDVVRVLGSEIKVYEIYFEDIVGKDIKLTHEVKSGNNIFPIGATLSNIRKSHSITKQNDNGNEIEVAGKKVVFNIDDKEYECSEMDFIHILKAGITNNMNVQKWTLFIYSRQVLQTISIGLRGISDQNLKKNKISCPKNLYKNCSETSNFNFLGKTFKIFLQIYGQNNYFNRVNFYKIFSAKIKIFSLKIGENKDAKNNKKNGNIISFFESQKDFISLVLTK